MEALELVTLGAAKLLFQENQKGSIEIGKFADFTVLDENPLTTELTKIKDIPVYGTVLGGILRKNLLPSK